jgi:TolB-like protein/Tfp pilus assembly protein PilF
VDVSIHEVADHLARMEASPGFLRAGRLARFLRFIVEETLQGRAGNLKEYTIAIEVFGRPPSYDPQVDSLVRVQASLLRTRLREYYAAQGRGERIRIEIPKGGCQPVIRRSGLPLWRRKMAVLGATAAVVIAGTGLWLLAGMRENGPKGSSTASVAVLPFADMSAAGDQAYLCDGMTEELIHALGHVRGLRVVARTSSFQYKGKAADVRRIGQELGVGAVVEGSVRRERATLRVTAQLVNTGDGYHVWSAAYSRRADDLFAVEEEIAQSIAERLQPRQAGIRTEPQDIPNPEAHRHYLTGLYWRASPSPEHLAKAIAEFRAAVVADPHYAAPQAALGEANTKLYFTETVPLSQTADIARSAVARAMELDNRLARAHEAAAVVHLIDWDMGAADREFRRGVELDPSDVRIRYAYAQLCLNPSGRHREAAEQLETAIRLDPVARYLITELGTTYLMRGELPRARREFQRSLELNPKALGTRTNLAAIDSAEGRYPQAMAKLEAVNAEGEGDARILGHLGYACARGGPTAEAQRALDKLTATRPTAALHIAAVYAGLGEVSRALDWLDRGVAAHSPSMLWLKTDFRFASLRSDPRFAELLARLP